MISMTLDDIARATGGQVSAPQPGIVSSVVIDSRRATDGALFVALSGEHSDGHDFAADAMQHGAVGVLAQRAVSAPAVIVDDVLSALARLARHVVDALPAQVVAVTGSSGKTTTKDLLAQVLERMGSTVAPIGSYNNEIGYPLTVLRADESTRYLVLEASARGVGHIAQLCEIAPPDVAVVLNVGSAHVGVFGGRDAIARAKGELVEAVGQGGVAVLNADDDMVAAMATRTAARVVRFGLTQSADVRASNVRMNSGRPSYVLHLDGESASVELQLYGEHHVSNSLAVAAAAHALGMPTSEIARALSQATPVSRWRMEVTDAPSGVTVINDAYNANPESVIAGLRALVAIAGERRTWAVLGEMAELGSETARGHERVGQAVAELGVDRLLAVGGDETAGSLATAAQGTHVERAADVAAAVELLQAELEPGDVVLVKASRAAGLERIANALLAAQVPA